MTSRPTRLRVPFDPPLVEGTLLRRYKRFLADVRLRDGREVTAHVPNTGAMTGCNVPGSRCWISPSDRPGRKLAWTLEVVDAGPALVAVHTGRTNDLAGRLLAARALPELAPWPTVRREVRFGRSRLDFVLEGARDRPPCALEVKSVTLARGELGLFPDAVTARGTRHLELLAELRRERGMEAALLFVVQRGDVRAVAPAGEIDPCYAETLRRVVGREGVLALAWGFRVSPREMVSLGRLPVRLATVPTP